MNNWLLEECISGWNKEPIRLKNARVHFAKKEFDLMLSIVPVDLSSSQRNPQGLMKQLWRDCHFDKFSHELEYHQDVRNLSRMIKAELKLFPHLPGLQPDYDKLINDLLEYTNTQHIKKLNGARSFFEQGVCLTAKPNYEGAKEDVKEWTDWILCSETPRIIISKSRKMGCKWTVTENFLIMT